MPGDYSDKEISEMGGMELIDAQKRGWKKPVSITEDLSRLNLGTSVPRDAATDLLSNPNYVTGKAYGAGWTQKQENSEEDFTTPSGEKCRIRVVPIEELLTAGILDKVSRLEGLADALVQQSQGQPPASRKMPSTEEFRELIEFINSLTCLAVVEPKVVPDETAELPAGAIKASWIDLEDRSAIMERVLRDVKKLDNFRNAG